MKRSAVIGLALALFLMTTMGARMPGNSPPYDPKTMEHLYAPDPALNLKDGDIVVPVLMYHLVGRSVLEKNGQSVSRFNVTAADFGACAVNPFGGATRPRRKGKVGFAGAASPPPQTPHPNPFPCRVNCCTSPL